MNDIDRKIVCRDCPFYDEDEPNQPECLYCEYDEGLRCLMNSCTHCNCELEPKLDTLTNKIFWYCPNCSYGKFE